VKLTDVSFTKKNGGAGVGFGAALTGISAASARVPADAESAKASAIAFAADLKLFPFTTAPCEIMDVLCIAGPPALLTPNEVS
jgi:hypothetical protein